MGKKLKLSFLFVLTAAIIILLSFIITYWQKGRNQKIIDTAETNQAKDTQVTQKGQDNSAKEDTRYQSVTYENLFDNSKLHNFKIVISRDEWNGLSQDMVKIQAIDGYMRTTNYRKADLYYTDDNGEVLIGEVGMRTKGNTSRVFPEDANGLHRFNFKLKFNETFDLQKGTGTYKDRKDREFAGMEELNFKANNGADPTNIRELYCYNLINEFGITASKASMATLTIVVNGKEHDYGVVKYIEPVDKDFLKRRFGKDKNDGNLYKCLWQNYGPATLMPINNTEAIGIKDSSSNYRPAYDLKTNKEEKNYQDLQDFITNINTLEGKEFKNYIEKHFSVDRFLRSQALDCLLGNIDGYRSMGNNYYLYFNENGIVEWIPYDYDNILGAGWSGDPNWSYEGIATADIYQWKNLNAVMYDSNTTHPLFDKIIAIDEYKKKYDEYLATLIDAKNNYFSYDKFMEMYQRFSTLYGPSVDNEPQEGNVWELSNEKWYFSTKLNSVKQQLGLK